VKLKPTGLSAAQLNGTRTGNSSKRLATVGLSNCTKVYMLIAVWIKCIRQ